MTSHRPYSDQALRVRLTCAFDGDGDEGRELPFVVAVLADFAAENDASAPPLPRREFVTVTERSLDAFMNVVAPRLTVTVPDELRGAGEATFRLEFRRLADFEPDALAQQAAPLRALADLRVGLAAAKRRLALSPTASDTVLTDDAAAVRRLNELADPRACSARSDNGQAEDAALLNKRLASLVADAGPGARPQLIDMIDDRLAEIDALIGAQLDAVLHCPAFQRLEATWRGLALLVGGVPKGAKLKVKAMTLSIDELRDDLAAAAVRGHDGGVEGLDRRSSHLHDALYAREYGQHGGEPFGMLVLDHDLGVDRRDVEALTLLGLIAADAHMPTLAAAAPQIIGRSSFAEMGEAPATPAEQSPSRRNADGWRRFRQNDAARYVGLAAPRVAGRPPHRRDLSRAAVFPYDETIIDAADYLWISSVYLLARRICRAFERYGWCVAFTGLTGGGTEGDAPVIDFGLGDEARSPTAAIETLFTEAQEQSLQDAGLIALSPVGGEAFGAFYAARSPYIPRPGEPGAAAQLPYTFAVSRVAHHLKVMTRESIGRSQSRTAIEMDLNRWLAQYVTYQDDASQEARARRPLREGSVTLAEAAGEPGVYVADIALKPHYQLEVIDFSIRLKTLLQPSAG